MALLLQPSEDHFDCRTMPTVHQPAFNNSPLKQTWEYWEQTVAGAQSNAVDYKECTKPISTFKTIGEFWSVFHYLPQPSSLLRDLSIVRVGANGGSDIVVNALMFFRKGVRPEWEDPQNANGGHFQFHWKPTVDPNQLDEYWNNLVLAVIGNTVESDGEQPSHAPIITGLRLVDKTKAEGRMAGIRIECWFSKPADSRHLQRVRTKVEKAVALRLDGRLGVIPRCEVRYHNTAKGATLKA